MLTVRDLTCTRGGAAVLSGVRFAVGTGEGLVLRGPNGIGKTTLLRTLAGLQPALKGEVITTPETTAYASHADGVKAALTVRENLAFWAEVHGSKLDETAFDHFDIADLIDRIAGTLSAGQKRRLGLARLAVVNRPVLLLDEPTVSLDGFSVKLFAKYLKDTHLANGGAAVIATHIDLGLDLPELDLTPFKATEADNDGASDEAFL